MPLIEDDHPVDSGVRAAIESRLAVIEADYGVRILYACESGSRGWGFASPDSDYDVRFIYVHPLPWYLQVTPQRNVIELPVTDELDINDWELRKALGLLKKGNTTLIEWLDSPVVYRADTGFLRAMQDAARQTHQAERSLRHYAHMARRNYREHLTGATIRLKKYLYVVRPLMAARWIEQERNTAPMPFQQLVDALVTDPVLRRAIDELLAFKRTLRESEYGAPLPVIDAFITAELTRLESILPPPALDMDFSALDQLLMETVLRFDALREPGKKLAQQSDHDSLP